MKPLYTLFTTFALASGLTAGGQPAAPHFKHILLIFTDQQNRNAMSAYGNANIQTPNMDALCRDGVRYLNSYCTSPVSGPSRASLVTGLMARETGVEWNDNSELNSDVQTIGQILASNGYRSVWAGKWHIPEIYPNRSSTEWQSKHGFEFMPFWSADNKRWLLGTETDPPLTTAVVKFIDDYDNSQPLFLVVSYHNPHDICMYPRRVGWGTSSEDQLLLRPFGKYRLPYPMWTNPLELDSLPPLPINHAIGQEPEFVVDKRTKTNPYGDEVQLAAQFSDLEWRAYLKSYYRLTEMVDCEIGKVIDALKRKDMYESTLLIFTSDHGDGMAAHKWASKLSFYEESATVPLIIVSPDARKQRGSVSRKIVSLVDVTPTICDYAGVNAKIDFAGQSLLSTRPWQRKYVVSELADDVHDPNRKGRMIRSQRYKYMIYSTGKDQEQLFDLQKDAGEMANLAQDPRYHKILIQHRTYLREWITMRNDNFRNGKDE